MHTYGYYVFYFLLSSVYWKYVIKSTEIFKKLRGKGNYANKGTDVGMNTVWWVPSRHFELIRVWQ